MKKLKNSFGGIIFGFIMLIGGTILLWYNEGNNVKNIKATNEAAKTVIDVKSDNVDANNEGKLVALSGPLTTEDTLTDDIFKLSVKTPVLKRVVEIYEWEEITESNEDGNTTYSYKLDWHEELIDSSSFHQGGHNNPTSMEYTSEEYYASNVKVGVFNLSSNQIKKLSASKNYPVTNIENKKDFTVNGNYLTTTKETAKVGDIRISFYYNDWTEASVMAVQTGNTFTDFVAKSGKSINRVEQGILTSDNIIAHMVKSNNTLKWTLRVIGAVIIVLGYLTMINPLTTLTSFVPVLGNLASSVLSLVALIIGIIHTLIVITIAWIRFRPILGISLLVICVLLVLILKGVIIKKKDK